ncbi:MAG: OsmC family protein, partial [Candidatus Kapabacteria bacterium]|nr:OsmC family protein [Candidatus Kapabacteria bacterium]
MAIRVFFPGNKKVYAEQNGFIIQTDQPKSSGGEGSAPAPFELFLASIATCGGIYVKSFCDSRNIPSDNIELIQSLKYDNVNHRISEINIKISVPQDFPEKYYDALVKSVNQCAVKKAIFDPPVINVFTEAK